MKKLIIMFLTLSITSAIAVSFFLYKEKKELKEVALFYDGYDRRHNYETSFKAYAKALGSSGALKHIILYNMANMTFKEAVAKKNLLLLKTSVEYYKEALRIDPDFMPAKRNAEIAEALLKYAEASVVGGDDDKEGERSRQNGGKPGLMPYVPSEP